MLKATYDEKQLLAPERREAFHHERRCRPHLVLARSEEGTKDGRGLSMFIYDKRDGGVNVRRIETKWVSTVRPPANWYTRMRNANFAATASSV